MTAFESSAPARQRVEKLMPIKNAAERISVDLRPEYDLSKLTGGIQGKYYKRATAGTTLVLLEPDVAEAFPDGRTFFRGLPGKADVRPRNHAYGDGDRQSPVLRADA